MTPIRHSLDKRQIPEAMTIIQKLVIALLYLAVAAFVVGLVWLGREWDIAIIRDALKP